MYVLLYYREVYTLTFNQSQKLRTVSWDALIRLCVKPNCSRVAWVDWAETARSMPDIGIPVVLLRSSGTPLSTPNPRGCMHPIGNVHVWLFKQHRHKRHDSVHVGVPSHDMVICGEFTWWAEYEVALHLHLLFFLSKQQKWLTERVIARTHKCGWTIEKPAHHNFLPLC